MSQDQGFPLLLCSKCITLLSWCTPSHCLTNGRIRLSSLPPSHEWDTQEPQIKEDEPQILTLSVLTPQWCIIWAATVRGNSCLWLSGAPFSRKQLLLFQEVTASKSFELFLMPVTSGVGRCVLTSAFTPSLLSFVSNSS